MAIRIIVGLRNPGPGYEKTRHNAGAWFVQSLAAEHQLSFKTDKKFSADWTVMDDLPSSCILFLPLDFMNLNGKSLRTICQYYNISAQEILVAHDELYLPPGCIRLKTGGGHGGHNGLRDVISQLQTADFHRLRVGIGQPQPQDVLSDYVLSQPRPEDKDKINQAIMRALPLLPDLIGGRIALAMNQLNRKQED